MWIEKKKSHYNSRVSLHEAPTNKTTHRIHSSSDLFIVGQMVIVVERLETDKIQMSGAPTSSFYIPGNEHPCVNYFFEHKRFERRRK